MLRVAITTDAMNAKDIIFVLGDILKQWDWTFRYYEKLSYYVKDMDKEYDILILSAQYNTQRVYNSLIKDHKEQIVIYITQHPELLVNKGRIIYIYEKDIDKDKLALSKILLNLLIGKESFLFNYNGVHMTLRYDQIYYVEKQGKNLIYHTSRGKFIKRGNISDAQKELMKYKFVRSHSSFLINMRYISVIKDNEVMLGSKYSIPISRSRHKEFLELYQEFRK